MHRWRSQRTCRPRIVHREVAGKEAVRDQVTAVATVVEKVMAMAGGVERAVRREGVTEAAVVDQSSLCKHIWRLQRPTMRR